MEQPDHRCRIRFLGHLVAVCAGQHGAVRAAVVRRAVPRRRTDRMGRQARPRPRRAALDALGRLAFRGVCLHHGVRPDGQRLPVPQGRAGGAGRQHGSGDGHRLPVHARQARLVPLSVPGQRRVLSAVQAGADALPGGRRGLAPVAGRRSARLGAAQHPDPRGAGGGLRPHGGAAPHGGQLRLPHVRALQRPPRRHRAAMAFARRRSGARGRHRGRPLADLADRVRPAGRGHWRLSLERQPLVRGRQAVDRHVADRPRRDVAAGRQRAVVGADALP